MRITVRTFAQAREATGAAVFPIELTPGACVRDALAEIERAHPALVSLSPVLATAVDGELVKRDAALADGVELALLPPVSGG